jgi:hypothetical protein
MRCSFLFYSAVLAAAPSILAQASSAPTNAKIPSGYTMTAVATGLNFPTALTFAGDTIWVTEVGFRGSPAVKTVDQKGNVQIALSADMLPTGTLISPLTGITFA